MRLREQGFKLFDTHYIAGGYDLLDPILVFDLQLHTNNLSINQSYLILAGVSFEEK